MTDRTVNPDTGLNRRELYVLGVVIHCHREFGLEKQFTAEAIGHIADGPVSGSLAGLAMLGFVEQRTGPEGLCYRALDRGWMEYAGVNPKDFEDG